MEQPVLRKSAPQVDILDSPYIMFVEKTLDQYVSWFMGETVQGASMDGHVPALKRIFVGCTHGSLLGLL